MQWFSMFWGELLKKELSIFEGHVLGIFCSQRFNKTVY
jgi:hypothetical protein